MYLRAKFQVQALPPNQTITNMNIAFWGTPELTTTYLDALKASGFLPCVIITNPDRPKGRGQKLGESPAKIWGKENNIPVLTPEKLDTDFKSRLSIFNLDVSLVVAYGKIMPEDIINIPQHGTLNVHYSLLPHLRGASPVESAILAGEKETGVSIQIMRKVLDSGPVIAEEKTAIGEDETTPALRARLSEMGAKLLVNILADYISGKLEAKEQDDSLATFCKKIKKEDGEINLNDDPETNWRKYKAYKESPRTYFFEEENGKKVRMIISSSHYEDGRFIIDRIIPEGRKEQPYTDK